ncbi:S-formylglutathione hydrolase [Tropicimonas marinistellae]|uniref:S-formylglutathione hydrolase n=1 Tax=Tropicimonas marinistellae TaxID=1739787 RepID=UPI001F460DBB|nr:S-formylglutathione hydrolase [Tropicimonas marinistellae]
MAGEGGQGAGVEIVSENRCFGGIQGVYRHVSAATGCDMTFAVYQPPQAETRPVPVLWYLSGLTCTHENAMTKGGFQEHAARHGIALVFPDTSPRGEGIADDDSYDLGQGAGFYVNATQAPWAPHFRMYDYIVTELRETVNARFPVTAAQGITGHSMGGHGALTIALKNPDIYYTLSAFAPISNPTQSDWGRRQFGAYLGDDETAWREYDASILLEERGWKGEILVDQGGADQFLDLLRPEALASAIGRRRQAAVLRIHPGYDHSYFFMSTFASDHVAWHAERLGGARG